MTQEVAQQPHQDHQKASNAGQADDKEVFYRAASSFIKNQSLISLLSSRPPYTRTQKQCKSIAEYLKLQPYFQKISKNFKILFEISSWIQYRKVELGEYIYRVHDVADSFYILLTGQVHLTYPEREVLETDDNSLMGFDANSTKNIKDSTFYPTSIPTLTKNQTMASPSLIDQSKSPKRLTKHESLYVNDMIQIIAPTPKRIVFEQRIVQIVASGECFGDLGDSNRRGTNAVSKEQSHLLVIKKQHYGTLSSAHIKSENNIKYQLLSSLPLFKLLYRYSLESIIYLLEEVKVGYNNIIYNECDPIKYVYIIYKGEFKLYKNVKNKKDSRTNFLQNQQHRAPCRNLSFKNIQIGEILAYCQVYEKINGYLETCVCKSQQGVILRIEKNKFIKKILSTENNLEEVVSFLSDRTARRNQQMSEFLKKHQNNSMFVRYLHTPSAKSRRVNTESSIQRLRSQRKDELRRLSTEDNNFFNQFNKTIKQQVRSTRISVKKSITFNEQKNVVPSRIKDIVGIVNQESNYYKIRKPKENITLFEFSISKVPIHVKKKYEILFKKQNK